MSIFFISDLHLGHANIIKYCHRPFETVGEMNNEIIRRWNKTVSKGDTVYMLGDLCMGNDPGRWINRLNGHIKFVKGNHDRNLKAPEVRLIDCNGEKIMLMHNTDDIPAWTGWAIGGHHHNNSLKENPLINKERRRINVSAELLDYYPIEAGALLSMR